MTDHPTECAAALSDERLEYECHVCCWQFATIGGLWAHIPTHQLTQAQYGTLAKHADEIARLRADLDAMTARAAALEVAGEDLVRLLQQSLWHVPDGSGIRTGFRYTELAWRRALAADTPAAGPGEGES